MTAIEAGVRPAGRMADKRVGHQTVALADGTVLIIGGASDGNYSKPVAVVERWNPSTGEFSPAGKLCAPRSKHAAVVLSDGRILVVGGQDKKGLGVAKAELWAPDDQQWSQAGTILNAEQRAPVTAIALLDGGALLVGKYGETQRWAPKAKAFVEAISPKSDSYSHYGVALSDGRIRLVGDKGDLLTWNPESSTWAASKLPEVFDNRRGIRAASIGNDQILICGGITDDTQPNVATSAAVVWRADNDQLETVGDMVVPRATHIMCLLTTGEVLVSGGTRGQKVAKYGGFEFDNLTEFEVFDVRSRTFRAAGALKTYVSAPSFAALHDGRAFMTGGMATGGAIRRDAEIWSNGKSAAPAYSSINSAVDAKALRKAYCRIDGQQFFDSAWVNISGLYTAMVDWARTHHPKCYQELGGGTESPKMLAYMLEPVVGVSELAKFINQLPDDLKREAIRAIEDAEAVD